MTTTANIDSNQSVPEEVQEDQLSIVHGPADVPLLDFKLGDFLDFQCIKYASKECLVIPWTGARWTYEWLRQESVWLARALADRGIQPGDRVAIMAGNCEHYAVVFFACVRIGAILVILNNTYTAAEAHYALDFTDCKMLFTTPWIGQHDNRQLLADISRGGKHPELEVVILRGFPRAFTSYASLQEHGSQLPNDRVDECNDKFTNHDICNLQFTSGTTGNPKAASLTHHSILNNARFIGDRMALTSDDVLCCPPPLFHCFGLVLGLLAIITHGGKVVYPTETFSPAACLRAISDEQCTAIHGVPAMFDSLFSLPRPEAFESTRLRTGIIAGAPVPRHLMEIMVHDLGMTEFTSSYGLTEASPTCFNAFVTDSISKRLETVGTVMPHAHAKIVDRHGHIVPLGVRGELCMAGYQLQAGYWNNKDKTDEVMLRDEDGVLWLHTGDEAYFHADGSCTITGRFKDIIIRGGENIYPLEIEERLCAHEAIDSAIVVGVKHPRLGEVPAAFLHLAAAARGGGHQPHVPELSEVQLWVKQRLGRHKAPQYIFWLGRDGVPSDVPLTGSGKVKKYEMARLAEQLLKRNNGSKL